MNHASQPLTFSPLRFSHRDFKSYLCFYKSHRSSKTRKEWTGLAHLANAMCALRDSVFFFCFRNFLVCFLFVFRLFSLPILLYFSFLLSFFNIYLIIPFLSFCFHFSLSGLIYFFTKRFNIQIVHTLKKCLCFKIVKNC